MKSITNARQELNNLKNDVIGLVLIHGTFHLVTEVDETTFDSIFITHFGAIQRDFSVSRQMFNVKLFPDNKNMNEMLDNPFEFDAFIKSFSF